MNKKEAIEYIESNTWSKTKLGLDRTRELLHLLGDPQKKLKFVHVAGTNGKGSTCAMLASILSEAGYCCGLYTSPHIVQFNERMQVNGINISDDDLIALAEKVKLVVEMMKEHPSQFEIITAMAMLYFIKKKCDIVVLEVGLGGLLDSTNVIDKPEVAVITNIGLEHTEYLGDTLEKIASAKAGIIKQDCLTVCYRGSQTVEKVFENKCIEMNSKLIKAKFDSIKLISSSLKGQYFSYDGLDDLFIPLLGEHQLKNASVVIEAIRALRNLGWKISDEALCNGLRKTVWIVRFELVDEDPLFIIDGAHNPQCVQELANTIDKYLPKEKVTFILGVLKDKNYLSMIRSVLPYGENYICVTPDSSRALSNEELKNVIDSLGGKAIAVSSLKDSIKIAKELSQGKPIVAFGSLYMVGLLRQEYLKQKKTGE